MTKHFCESCNRMQLTQLWTYLYKVMTIELIQLQIASQGSIYVLTVAKGFCSLFKMFPQ